MGSVENWFIQTVRREAILPVGCGVIAAVSGGSDSVSMLLLLEAFAGHMEWDLSVLHIDHGTRETSAAEAGFVRRFAEDHGLRCIVRRLEWSARAAPSEAMMSRARQRIYELEAGRVEKGGALVAVGHTADDRAETLLMRLSEGAGLRGLGGMDYRGSGPVRRPVLDLTREDLTGYLRERGVEWVEDPTNRDPSIRRNRIRHELIPLFESIVPGATERIAASSGLLSSWRDFSDREIMSALALVRRDQESGGQRTVDRPSWSGLPAALRLGVLWHLCGRPRHGLLELRKTDRWLMGGGRGEHLLPGGAGLSADEALLRIEEASAASPEAMERDAEAWRIIDER